MRAIADAKIEDSEGAVGDWGEGVGEAIIDRDLRRSSIQLSSRDSSVWHSIDDVSRIGVVLTKILLPKHYVCMYMMFMLMLCRDLLIVIQFTVM